MSKSSWVSPTYIICPEALHQTYAENIFVPRTMIYVTPKFRRKGSKGLTAHFSSKGLLPSGFRDRILVQVTIYRRLRISRDVHLDQSEAYDISQLVREYGPRMTGCLARRVRLIWHPHSVCTTILARFVNSMIPAVVITLRHETMTRCWLKVVPPSETTAQH